MNRQTSFLVVMPSPAPAHMHTSCSHIRQQIREYLNNRLPEGVVISNTSEPRPEIITCVTFDREIAIKMLEGGVQVFYLVQGEGRQIGLEIISSLGNNWHKSSCLVVMPINNNLSTNGNGHNGGRLDDAILKRILVKVTSGFRQVRMREVEAVRKAA